MLLKWQNHPYHLTEQSVWPVVTSLSLFCLTSSAALYFHHFEGAYIFLLLSIYLVVSCIIFWTVDVSREGDLVGDHTSYVVKGLTLGFAMFVFTEVMFFFSLFWGYFHSALNPTIDIGAIWPPAEIDPINAYELPLLNTVLLLSSGGTLTYSHHKLIQGERIGAINGLFSTILLGFVFLICQYIEFKTASFTIVDSVYGSIFYMVTAFHGFHVIVGALMLTTCFIRMRKYCFTTQHHIGFESSTLYWHFVDVVWLIVLSSLYFWGS